jgi:pyruvate,water dikinase
MNLAHMSQQAVPVPPWFCVAAEAFDLFVEQNDLRSELHPGQHLERLGTFAREVENRFLRLPLPALVEQELHEQLQAMQMSDSLLAIRSSGIDEDSAGHSFAGQFSSFLCQRGPEAISESIRRCWASGFSERAIAYRVERGLSVAGIRVGVVVQSMVEPIAAGVAFSRNPIHPLDRDHLVIESVFGLGEGLVSGELDADHFELSRDDLTIEHRAIADKETAVRFGEHGGVIRKSLEPQISKKASLNDAQVRDIGAMVLRLERSYGTPQDAEWVVDQAGSLYVVQTRPITTLPAAAFFDAAINGREVILWDNSNIIESYSGVTSPLTFSFANAAYRKVYIQFCQVMGVPQKEIDSHDPMYRNMLGLIRGQIYYNLINWYRLIQMLPLAGTSADFMETMMGVKQELKPELASLFDFMQNPPRYSLQRKLWVTALSAWRFIRIDTIVDEFQQRFNAIYEDARHKEFSSMSLPALADYYQFLDENVLGNWRAPIINDYVCMIFFGVLKKLTDKWVAGGDDGASLQNDLLCGQGGLESTEPTKLLMSVARWVDQQDQELKDWLETTPADEVWRQLTHEGRWPELRSRVDHYLDEYGFRCINELKLEEKDLHEDPSFIINAIRSYVRAGTFDIGALEMREAEIRDNAERMASEKLGGLRRIAYYWVLKHARMAVRNRENLRFARTKIFGIARRIFRAVGSQLQQLAVIKHERDVFLLTVEDIIGFIEGRPTTADLASLVAMRKKEFDEYRRSAPPPDRLITYGAAGVSFAMPQVLADADLLRGTADDSGDPNVLVGTPCCPGIVEGVVRVAETSKDAEGVEQEILVTARTDPGWVPLYPSCAGLLIERGSLLSHSAVVARELGLPTIVGISGGLMAKLKTGQRVRMDAGRGEVRILS